MTSAANAQKLKEEGNQCFKEKRYHKAIDLYTKSLNEIVDPVVLGNRAQAELNVHKWNEALMDCNKALQMDPKLPKLIYRRALALEGLGLCASARRDALRCLQLVADPAATQLAKKLEGKRDAEMIMVKCCEKGEEIRSSAEVKDIKIEVVEPKRDQPNKPPARDVEQEPSTSSPPNVSKMVIPPPPKTYSEFFNHFEALKLYPEAFATYFMNIPLSSYNSLFDDLLEADSLSVLLAGISKLLTDPGTTAKVLEMLLRLSSVSRFELLAMFLSKDDKTNLVNFCDQLSAPDAILLKAAFGMLQDLKRDVQARLLTVETYGGETFLSEDVAIGILQETKNAFTRASMLCEQTEVAKHSENILDILILYLFIEHLDYAVELAISGISLAEQKTEPPSYYFDIVSQNTTVVLLLIKQYEDSVYPLVKGTVVEQSVVKKWTSSLRSLEAKINLGMERQLNAIVGYIKFLLATEQKKTDFRPEQTQFDIGVSGACTMVVKFLERQVKSMVKGCDGNNLLVIQSELATRLYKLFLSHIQQFIFNSAGATLLLCDVNEYRRCISQWKTPEAGKLMERLQALANLLVVLPDNIGEAAHSQVLADVDRTLILDFLKLRSDYRTLKLNISMY